MAGRRRSEINEDSEEAQARLKFIDEIFVAFLREKDGLREKNRWLDRMRQDERYIRILRDRMSTTPERLAEDMGISVPKLYMLEQEIFQSYYSDFHSISRR